MLGSPTAQLERANQLTGQAAFQLLTKAAKRGLPAAWYRLGHAYLLGLGVPASLSDRKSVV